MPFNVCLIDFFREKHRTKPELIEQHNQQKYEIQKFQSINYNGFYPIIPPLKS
jgi:hypothetical protein